MTIRTYDAATTAIKSLNPDEKALRANDAYLAGDHYQKMEAWGGPPVPSSIEGYSETVSALERDQAPVPVLEEIAEHYVTGVVGNEPAFTVELNRELEEGEEPSVQEAEDIRTLNDALTAFFDNSGAAETIQQFVENLCSGRGVLRPIFPPSLVESGKWQGRSLTETAGSFDMEAPQWSHAGVKTDKRSNEKTGIYLYADEADDLTAPPRQRAEITYIRDDGKTVFEVFENGKEVVGQDGGEKKENVYDCNGHIWLFQATLRKPILGRVQRELQRKVDFHNYVLPKNTQYAGFRGHNFFGVDRPKDENGEETDPEMGPGIVAFWQASVTEVDGKQVVMPANLVLTEPVDSGPIRADILHFIEIMLKSRHLLHTVMAGDAVASAISRIQSRAQFTMALMAIKVKVERILRDLFTTVLCLACEFSNEQALLARLKSNYRIRVDIRIDAGPMTPDERRVVIELVAAGLMSKETALSMLGVEDISAEINALQSDPDSELASESKRAALLEQYTQIFDVGVAAKLAGYDEEQIKIMLSGETANAQQTDDDSDE